MNQKQEPENDRLKNGKRGEKTEEESIQNRQLRKRTPKTEEESTQNRQFGENERGRGRARAAISEVVTADIEKKRGNGDREQLGYKRKDYS